MSEIIFSKKIDGFLLYTFFISFLIFMVYALYQSRNHYAFTTGTVVNVVGPGYKSGGDYALIFHYSVNGKTYSDGSGSNFCGNQTREMLKKLFIGKRFPVVYPTKIPSFGSLILSPDQAAKFKYILPDSVKHYDSILHCIEPF